MLSELIHASQPMVELELGLRKILIYRTLLGCMIFPLLNVIACRDPLFFINPFDKQIRPLVFWYMA